MVPKRVASRETIESSIEEVVEQVPVNFPIYVDTQLLIEKESMLPW